MGLIIGIDLGTTTSEIAYLKNGKPEIITNKLGKRITPSVVGIGSDGKISVGQNMKNQLINKPEMTVSEIKRLMGTNEKVAMGEDNYLPEEISARILRYLKECAEEYLEENVTEAVITVPANFNDLQRSATKAAGEIAGLKVERIINEPTAAALAYGIDNLENEEKILVYDLGGGTFDVSILEMYDGILDVKVTNGDNELGGKDFDERIMEHIFEEFLRKNNINLRNNAKARALIKDASEQAKIDLSSMDTTEINIPFICLNEGEPLGIEMRLSRTKFEELTFDLIAKTEQCINKAIDRAKEKYGYSERDIDMVLPIGGSTRIPAVKRLLKERFGEKVKSLLNPDEAVALGAAVQAGIKSGEIDEEKSILITDVCPFTLGTSVMEKIGGRNIYDLFDPLIERDTTIPCSRKKIYFTSNDNQTKVNIDIYQGDARLINENQLIGDFILDGVPEDVAGGQAIEVEFNYDINGILGVNAVILSTGKRAGISIDTNSMNQNDIILAKRKLELDWKKSSLATKVELIIVTAEEKIDKADSEAKIKIQVVLDKLKEALVKEDEYLVDKYDEELTNILFDI